MASLGLWQFWTVAFVGRQPWGRPQFHCPLRRRRPWLQRGQKPRACGRPSGACAVRLPCVAAARLPCRWRALQLPPPVPCGSHSRALPPLQLPTHPASAAPAGGPPGGQPVGWLLAARTGRASQMDADCCLESAGRAAPQGMRTPGGHLSSLPALPPSKGGAAARAAGPSLRACTVCRAAAARAMQTAHCLPPIGPCCVPP